jgi:hypothetical protein
MLKTRNDREYTQGDIRTVPDGAAETTAGKMIPLDVTEAASQVVIFASRLRRRPSARATATLSPSVVRAENQGSVWDLFAALRAQLTPEDIAKLPPDLAEQHDHYIYGTPKKR